MANSRPSVEPAPVRDLGPGAARDAFAYFGNLNPFKGVTVALDAVARMARQGLSPSLAVHGGSLYQTPEFRQRVADGFDAARGLATAHGPYRPQEMPALMAAADWVVMPSIWWRTPPWSSRRPSSTAARSSSAASAVWRKRCATASMACMSAPTTPPTSPVS